MEEREQKTVAQAIDRPKGDKLEAEGLSGVQTFMEITEDRLVEVQIDEQHLLEIIVSPYNISRAIRKVMSNGGSGGVDGMSVKDLPKYLAEVLGTPGQRVEGTHLDGEIQACARTQGRNPQRQRKDAQVGHPDCGRPRNPTGHSAGAWPDV